MAKIRVSEDGLAQMVRGLLKDDYGQDSVLREVLQNADDAKASSLVLSIQPGKPSQNPLLATDRLIIANNGPLTEKDKSAIAEIYEPNRVADREKVGKFGLGLKSVFHWAEGYWVIESNRGVITHRNFVHVFPDEATKYTSDEVMTADDVVNDIAGFVSNKYSNVLNVGDTGNFLIIALPLRTEAQIERLKDEKQLASPLSTVFPNIRDHFELAKSSLPYCLVGLQSVEQLVIDDGANRLDVKLVSDDGNRMRRGQNAHGPRSITGRLEISDGNTSKSYPWSVVHETSSDVALESIANSPAWPSTSTHSDDGGITLTKERSLQHSAVMCIGTGLKKIRIRHAVFLPLSEMLVENQLDTTAGFDIVLHSSGFTDKGRRYIQFDTSADVNRRLDQVSQLEERELKLLWNRILREKYVLPKVIDAFDAYRVLQDVPTLYINKALGALCTSLADGAYQLDGFSCLSTEKQLLPVVQDDEQYSVIYKSFETSKTHFRLDRSLLHDKAFPITSALFLTNSVVCDESLSSISATPPMFPGGLLKKTSLSMKPEAVNFITGFVTTNCHSFIDDDWSVVTDVITRELLRENSALSTQVQCQSLIGAVCSYIEVVNISDEFYSRLVKHSSSEFVTCLAQSRMIVCREQEFRSESGRFNENVSDALLTVAGNALSTLMPIDHVGLITTHPNYDVIALAGDAVYEVLKRGKVALESRIPCMLLQCSDGQNPTYRVVSLRSVISLISEHKVWRTATSAPLIAALYENYVACWFVTRKLSEQVATYLLDGSELMDSSDESLLSVFRLLGDLTDAYGARRKLFESNASHNLKEPAKKVLRFLLHGSIAHLDDIETELTIPGQLSAEWFQLSQYVGDTGENWTDISAVGNLEFNDSVIRTTLTQCNVTTADEKSVVRRICSAPPELLANAPLSSRLAREIYDIFLEDEFRIARDKRDTAFLALPIHRTEADTRISLHGVNNYLCCELPIPDFVFPTGRTIVRRLPSDANKTFGYSHKVLVTRQNLIHMALTYGFLPQLARCEPTLVLDRLTHDVVDRYKSELSVGEWLPLSNGGYNSPRHVASLTSIPETLLAPFYSSSGLHPMSDLIEPFQGAKILNRLYASESDTVRKIVASANNADAFYVGPFRHYGQSGFKERFSQHCEHIVAVIANRCEDPALFESFIVSQPAEPNKNQLNALLDLIRNHKQEFTDEFRDALSVAFGKLRNQPDALLGILASISLPSADNNTPVRGSELVLFTENAKRSACLSPSWSAKLRDRINLEAFPELPEKSLSEYFSASMWDNCGNASGLFLSALAWTPEVREIADRKLKSGLSAEALWRQMFDIDESNPPRPWIVSMSSRSATTAVPANKLTGEFVMVETGGFNSILEGNVRTSTSRYRSISFTLVEPPMGYPSDQLKDLLFDTLVKVTRELPSNYGELNPIGNPIAAPVSVQKLKSIWDRYCDVNQASLNLSRQLILNEIRMAFQQLGETQLHSRLRIAYKDAGRLITALDNSREEVSSITELDDPARNGYEARLSQSSVQMLHRNQALSRELREFQLQLAQQLDTEPELWANLSKLVADKLRDASYSEESFVLEFIQNADDALTQRSLAGLTTVPGRFSIRIGDKSVEIIHNGRPINFYGTSDGRANGFDRDLVNMLRITATDKPSTQDRNLPIVGRYGLGFKSVMLLTDTVNVVSGDLKVCIRGGVWPSTISDDMAGNLSDLAFDRESTVYQFNYDGISVRPNLDVVKYVPVMASSLRELRVDLKGDIHEWKWNETTITEEVSLFRCADDACLAIKLPNFKVIPERVVFRISEHGIISFSAPMPAYWSTVPTRDVENSKVIINASFPLNSARSHVDRDKLEWTRFVQHFADNYKLIWDSVKLNMPDIVLRIGQEMGFDLPLPGIIIEQIESALSFDQSLFPQFYKPKVNPSTGEIPNGYEIEDGAIVDTTQSQNRHFSVDVRVNDPDIHDLWNKRLFGGFVQVQDIAAETYGDGIGADKEWRSSWSAFVLRASLEGVGRMRPEQKVGFVRYCKELGIIDELSQQEVIFQKDKAKAIDAVVARIQERWSDFYAEPLYSMNVGEILRSAIVGVDIDALATFLHQLVNPEIAERDEDPRKIVSDLYTPSSSAYHSRLPSLRVLFGPRACHFMMREVIRARFQTGQETREDAYPYCFVAGAKHAQWLNHPNPVDYRRLAEDIYAEVGNSTLNHLFDLGLKETSDD
jgi:hypothetical protein